MDIRMLSIVLVASLACGPQFGEPSSDTAEDTSAGPDSNGSAGSSDGGGPVTTGQLTSADDPDDPSTGAGDTTTPDGAGSSTGDDLPDATGADSWDTSDEPEECNPLPAQDPTPPDADGDCNVHGEYRPCSSERTPEGTQFCDTESWERPDWGACLESYDCVPGEFEICFWCDSEFGDWLNQCQLHAGIPGYNPDACDTPLVLRFADRPVEFTDRVATFAMTAGGDCPATDWPTAATPWLAIDLDRSGSIDGGHELFGSGSALAGPGRPVNGFVPLATLDSDGDRRLTVADARWSELVVWSDHDSDRRSTQWELEDLASRGVVAIDLEYELTASRCDVRGNCELERASFQFRGVDGRLVSGEVVDLRLHCQ
jgi:hypothetical protein